MIESLGGSLKDWTVMAILGQPKPMGEAYMNTVENWGCVHIRSSGATPEPSVAVDFEVYLPEAEDLRRRAVIDGFTGTQPYYLVLIGEKSSLRDVLGPIAAERGADLHLPTDDPSDTMFYAMAKSGVTEGRPMVV
jgi:hypothetical protein